MPPPATMAADDPALSRHNTNRHRVQPGPVAHLDPFGMQAQNYALHTAFQSPPSFAQYPPNTVLHFSQTPNPTAASTFPSLAQPTPPTTTAMQQQIQCHYNMHLTGVAPQFQSYGVPQNMQNNTPLTSVMQLPHQNISFSCCATTAVPFAHNPPVTAAVVSTRTPKNICPTPTQPHPSHPMPRKPTALNPNTRYEPHTNALYSRSKPSEALIPSPPAASNPQISSLPPVRPGQRVSNNYGASAIEFAQGKASMKRRNKSNAKRPRPKKKHKSKATGSSGKTVEQSGPLPDSSPSSSRPRPEAKISREKSGRRQLQLDASGSALTNWMNTVPRSEESPLARTTASTASEVKKLLPRPARNAAPLRRPMDGSGLRIEDSKRISEQGRVGAYPLSNGQGDREGSEAGNAQSRVAVPSEMLIERRGPQSARFGNSQGQWQSLGTSPKNSPHCPPPQVGIRHAGQSGCGEQNLENSYGRSTSSPQCPTDAAGVPFSDVVTTPLGYSARIGGHVHSVAIGPSSGPANLSDPVMQNTRTSFEASDPKHGSRLSHSLALEGNDSAKGRELQRLLAAITSDGASHSLTNVKVNASEDVILTANGSVQIPNRRVTISGGSSQYDSVQEDLNSSDAIGMRRDAGQSNGIINPLSSEINVEVGNPTISPEVAGTLQAMMMAHGEEAVTRRLLIPRVNARGIDSKQIELNDLKRKEDQKRGERQSSLGQPQGSNSNFSKFAEAPAEHTSPIAALRYAALDRSHQTPQLDESVRVIAPAKSNLTSPTPPKQLASHLQATSPTPVCQPPGQPSVSGSAAAYAHLHGIRRQPTSTLPESNLLSNGWATPATAHQSLNIPNLHGHPHCSLTSSMQAPSTTTQVPSSGHVPLYQPQIASGSVRGSCPPHLLYTLQGTSTTQKSVPVSGQLCNVEAMRGITEKSSFVGVKDSQPTSCRKADSIQRKASHPTRRRPRATQRGGSSPQTMAIENSVSPCRTTNAIGRACILPGTRNLQTPARAQVRNMQCADTMAGDSGALSGSLLTAGLLDRADEFQRFEAPEKCLQSTNDQCPGNADRGSCQLERSAPANHVSNSASGEIETGEPGSTQNRSEANATSSEQCTNRRGRLARYLDNISGKELGDSKINAPRQSNSPPSQGAGTSNGNETQTPVSADGSNETVVSPPSSSFPNTAPASSLQRPQLQIDPPTSTSALEKPVEGMVLQKSRDSNRIGHPEDLSDLPNIGLEEELESSEDVPREDMKDALAFVGRVGNIESESKDQAYSPLTEYTHRSPQVEAPEVEVVGSAEECPSPTVVPTTPLTDLSRKNGETHYGQAEGKKSVPLRLPLKRSAVSAMSPCSDITPGSEPVSPPKKKKRKSAMPGTAKVLKINLRTRSARESQKVAALAGKRRIQVRQSSTKSKKPKQSTDAAHSTERANHSISRPGRASRVAVEKSFYKELSSDDESHVIVAPETADMRTGAPMPGLKRETSRKRASGYLSKRDLVKNQKQATTGLVPKQKLKRKAPLRAKEVEPRTSKKVVEKAMILNSGTQKTRRRVLSTADARLKVSGESQREAAVETASHILPAQSDRRQARHPSKPSLIQEKNHPLSERVQKEILRPAVVPSFETEIENLCCSGAVEVKRSPSTSSQSDTSETPSAIGMVLSFCCLCQDALSLSDGVGHPSFSMPGLRVCLPCRDIVCKRLTGTLKPDQIPDSSKKRLVQSTTLLVMLIEDIIQFFPHSDREKRDIQEVHDFIRHRSSQEVIKRAKSLYVPFEMLAVLRATLRKVGLTIRGGKLKWPLGKISLPSRDDTSSLIVSSLPRTFADLVSDETPGVRAWNEVFGKEVRLHDRPSSCVIYSKLFGTLGIRFRYDCSCHRAHGKEEKCEVELDPLSLSAATYRAAAMMSGTVTRSLLSLSWTCDEGLRYAEMSNSVANTVEPKELSEVCAICASSREGACTFRFAECSTCHRCFCSVCLTNVIGPCEYVLASAGKYKCMICRTGQNAYERLHGIIRKGRMDPIKTDPNENDSVGKKERPSSRPSLPLLMLSSNVRRSLLGRQPAADGASRMIEFARYCESANERAKMSSGHSVRNVEFHCLKCRRPTKAASEKDDCPNLSEEAEETRDHVLCGFENCGNVMHKECLPRDPHSRRRGFRAKWLCPHHKCSRCEQRDESRLIRCRTCPTTYCKEHVPLPSELYLYSEWDIACADCKPFLQAPRRPLQRVWQKGSEHRRRTPIATSLAIGQRQRQGLAAKMGNVREKTTLG